MDSLASNQTTAAKAHGSSPDSAFALLATEVLVDIISLAQPRLATAVATSFAIGRRSTGDSNRHRIGRHWRQHLIFHAPLARQVRHELDEPSPLGHWFPESKQLDARITYFFKSKLPAPDEHSEPASCIAPPHSADDGIFTTHYVDWLFDTSGPFARSFQAPMHGPNVFGEEWLLRWTFLPDAFQLVIFFLRGGHIDLFKHSLAHLARSLPELPSDLQRFSYWCQFGLDNRASIRSMFASEIATEDRLMPFPTYLYVLALVDWLPAALSALEALFPSNSAQLNSLLSDWSFPIHCMLGTTMSLCECPTRVISTLDWLLEGGYAFDHDVHPAFSPNTRCYSVFAAVFLKYDLPRLASIPKSVVQNDIGYHFATWARDGHRDLLPLAFEKGILGGDYLCENILGELLFETIRDSDEWLQESVVRCTETPEQLRAVVHQALMYGHARAPPRPAIHELDQLFDPLMQAAIDLTAFVLDHAPEWDQSILEVVLGYTRLADHLDLARIVNHWLGILATNQSLPEAVSATFIQLLHGAVDSDKLRLADLDTTAALYAFTACIHQLAFTHQFSLSPRFRPLLVALTAAARSGGNSLSSLPSLLRGQLREVVAAAAIRWDTIHDPELPKAAAAAAAAEAHLDARFAFKQVCALDPTFTKSCISWSPSPPCPYVWNLFDAKQLLGKVKKDVAIRALYQAIDRHCGPADFVAILERMPGQMRRDVLSRVLANVRGKSRALLAAVEQVDKECLHGLEVGEDGELVPEEDDDVRIDFLL